MGHFVSNREDLKCAKARNNAQKSAESYMGGAESYIGRAEEDL